MLRWLSTNLWCQPKQLLMQNRLTMQAPAGVTPPSSGLRGSAPCLSSRRTRAGERDAAARCRGVRPCA